MSGVDDMGEMEDQAYRDDTQGLRAGVHHLSDEEVIAFLDQRGQPDELWLLKQQHIIACPQCYKNMRSFERVRADIRDSYQSTATTFYPLIASEVMQRIEREKSLSSQRLFNMQRKNNRERRGHVYAFSFAAAVILLFTITTTLLVTTRSGVTAHPNRKVVATPTAAVQVGQHVYPSPTSTIPTPTSVPVIVPTSAPTPTATPGTMMLTNCTSSYDVVVHHLHVCGQSFIPGDKVVLILVDANGTIVKQIGPIHVLDSGTFTQTIPIHGCKDVPAVIYARDKAVPTQKVVELKNITFGNC